LASSHPDFFRLILCPVSAIKT